MARQLLLTALLAVAVGAHAAMAAPDAGAPAPALAVAPPDGVVLPSVGKPAEAVAGDRTTSWVWRAVYEVDAGEPALAAGPAGATPAITAIGIHDAQVRAAGRAVTGGPGPRFYYSIPGDRVVFVKPDDGPGERQRLRFVITVVPAGG